MVTYPWYNTLPQANKSLEQGDLIPKCPIIIPPSKIEAGGKYMTTVQTYDVVILSQSCDLENKKITNVLVCPYYTFQEYFDNYFDTLKPEEKTEKNKKKSYERHFEAFRQGQQPNYHLLDKEDSIGVKDYLVVDFRNVYAVHIQFLEEYAQKLENRIRLLPPYREHLAQAFARFFMRVGLPQGIKPLN